VADWRTEDEKGEVMPGWAGGQTTGHRMLNCLTNGGNFIVLKDRVAGVMEGSS